MFGYVTPLKEELKVKEYQFYKSVYCGLCHSMGKRVCGRSRMTLSYDIVFLALVRFAMTGEKISFEKKRCGASPFKKKVIVSSNPSLDYSGAAGALLSYYKIADDALDKRGIKRFASRIALLFSGKLRKKANLPDLDTEIKAALSKLGSAEATDDSNVSPDSMAEHFGIALRAIFKEGLSGDKARISGEIGYRIGRWIYLADAVDDYFSDRKSGEFNPLGDSPDITSLECAMRLELEAAALAYELSPSDDSGIDAIIKNILYLGLTRKTEELLKTIKAGLEENKSMA